MDFEGGRILKKIRVVLSVMKQAVGLLCELLIIHTANADLGKGHLPGGGS